MGGTTREADLPTVPDAMRLLSQLVVQLSRHLRQHSGRRHRDQAGCAPPLAARRSQPCCSRSQARNASLVASSGDIGGTLAGLCTMLEDLLEVSGSYE